VTPYYQDDAVTIYHGDCREILPTLPSADLVLTDPPYGINADSNAASVNGQHGWKFYGHTDWDNARPDRDTFEIVLAAATNAVVWGGNYFADLLPPSSCWLAWDKGQRAFSHADFELAWTSLPGAARMVVVPRAHAVADGKEHPTQKSLSVMRWCIALADDKLPVLPQTIVDPFAGSGTTLRAAKDFGRTVIGIEIEERYCEIAARRCAQEVLDFGPEPAAARLRYGEYVWTER
jgi:DNA modification methylase